MIIDTHVHIWKRTMYPDVIMDSYLEPLVLLDALYFSGGPQEGKDWLTAETDEKELLQNMEVAKIDRSVVLPLDFGLVGPTKKTVEEFNDWVFERASVYPDKIIPFIGVDPQRGELALRLLEKYVKGFDARGVKVYPPTGYFPNEARIDPFWKLVDEYGMAVVTHSGAVWGPLDENFSRPSYYREVLDKYHDLKLIIAHLGGKFREEMFPLVEAYDNAYTDCSALQGWLPSAPEGALARLKEVAQRIPQKVFFGTDWPLFELAYSQPYWVEFVKTQPWGSEEMKERLFSGNFLRMFTK
jgi:predicted TIM-barrel fold metal-dependent hydrolase